MKCFTDSAIELTCPGVPVTACASILPVRSNTPAERSPHSRTIGEKAVRISTCACSSTTAISRFHMICRSIRPMPSALLMGASPSVRLAVHDDTPGGVDAGIEARRNEGRGLVLGDDSGSGDARAGLHRRTAIERNMDVL